MGPNDPYYLVFKENTLSKSLIIAMEEAQAAGLKFGEDVVFYYGSSAGSFYDGPYPNFVNVVIREVKKAKEDASKFFNIPVANIPYGIAIEGHVYKNGDSRPTGHQKIPSKQQMSSTFARYKNELGYLYLIEVGVIQASPSDMIGYLDDAISAAYENKAEGVSLWLGVRDPSQPEPGWFDPALSYWIPSEKSPSTLAPSQMYYALTRSLYSLVPK